MSHPFALSAEQEARAARLHRESIVVDLLFQGPVGYRWFAAGGMTKGENPYQIYAKQLEAPVRAAFEGDSAMEDSWRASGITAGNREIDNWLPFFPQLAVAQAQFDRFGWLRKALVAQDIRAAKRDGVVSGYMSTQDTLWIGQDLAAIDTAYDLGLRMCQLTYNAMNLVGAGCTERTDAGVSNFGEKVIARMNALGILVDTSHCGKQTTLDACRLSGKPVVVSHSAAEGVYVHARGKSDEEIRAIADTGGVIGICCVPFFLSGAPHASIEAMLDHIDYVVQLAGWQHVAIGTDWPLQQPKWVLGEVLDAITTASGFRPEDKLDSTRNLVGFDSYEEFVNIPRGLVARGYTDEQIAGILGGNALRVFGEVWK